MTKQMTMKEFKKYQDELSDDIFHLCDGPLTSLVITSRACVLAAKDNNGENVNIINDNGHLICIANPIAEILSDWFDNNS